MENEAEIAKKVQKGLAWSIQNYVLSLSHFLNLMRLLCDLNYNKLK